MSLLREESHFSMNLGKYQDVLFISSIFLLTDVDRQMWLYGVCL